MEFPEVGTVGFLIALTAFFTHQFNLSGNKALAAAFGLALLFGLAPILSTAFPVTAPFVDVITNTILLTISAAGGYNIIMKVASKISGK